MAGRLSHEPVMATEIVALFADLPVGMVVDGTVGGAGHALAFSTQTLASSCSESIVIRSRERRQR
jgi:16S rRNA C1402 N4-methylase RsmH